MMRKRLWIFCLGVIMMLNVFAGCSRKPVLTDPDGSATENGTESIVGGTQGGTPADSSHATQQEPDPGIPAEPDRSFEAMRLPTDSVKSLAELGLSSAQYTALASNGNNGALDFISTVQSPDFSLTVNGQSVPVYATLAFVGSNGGHGAIHSFATVFVNTPASFLLDVALTPLHDEIKVKNSKILFLNGDLEVSREGNSLCATLNETGAYTFLCDDPDQDHAFVLYVRANVDDDARVAEYRRKYGDNVKVFEAGTHRIQNLMMSKDSVVYLCKGALLIAEPLRITSDVGLIEANNASNVTVTGYGIIEMSKLGHNERTALRSYGSSRVTVSDITLINNGGWNIYFYTSSNCHISGVTVLGHRMNSDGLNICNSTNVQVSDCWVRTGDDCFSGKTLGGTVGAFLTNTVFERCSAWSGKARCFGVTGEAQKSILGLTFRNCDLLFRDATWDNSRLGGLAVITEAGSSNGITVQDVVFEHIRIHYDTGRAINVTVLDASLSALNLNGIVFRDIVCEYTGMPFRFCGASGQNKVEVQLERVTVGGKPLRADECETDAYASVKIIS